MSKVLEIAGPRFSKYTYVNKVGIELEGGWNEPLSFVLDHDGSVQVSGVPYTGEYPSPPIAPKSIPSWMRDHYPDAVNETCGMHVHVSVKTQWHYASLMDPAFFDFLKSGLKAWGKKLSIRKDHPLWARLKGENTYCLDEFIPEVQVQQREKGGDRYTMLNYTWARYRTVECRVLPAFAACEIGISAVFAVVDLFEEYLRALNEDALPEIDGLFRITEIPNGSEEPLDVLL